MDYSPLTTSLRDLIVILFKRKWSLLTVLFVALFSSVFYLMIIRDDTYTAVAKIFIRLGHEQAPPNTTIGEQPISVGYRLQDVNSEIELLTSTDLVAQLVDELHLDVEEPKPVPEGLFRKIKYYSKMVVRNVREFTNNLMIMIGLREQLSPRDKAIELILRGLIVEAIEDTNVVVAGLSYNVRQNLSFVINHHVDNYLKFRKQIFENPAAVDFFQSQMDEARARLADAEKTLSDSETKWNIVSIEQQKQSLLEQIAVLSEQLDSAEREAARAQLKVRQLEERVISNQDDQNFALLGEFAPESFPKSLLEKLTTIELERELLRMSDTDDAIRVRTNRNQFQIVLELVSANLQSTLDEKQADVATLNKQIQELRDQLGKLHAHEAEWRSLQREVASLETSYNFYVRKHEEASAQAERDQRILGNASVIQKAIDPLMPSGIRKTYLLIAAGLLSVIAAVGWVAICEFFDHRIYTADALASRLAAPVLGVVPVDSTLRAGG